MALRYVRRFLIWIIILVAVAVAVNYLYTRYLRNRSAEEDPPILGSEMVQSALSIRHSHHKDGVLQFTIHAQRHLETRFGKNIFQGIEAFVYNPDGTVRNEIRSLRANYDEKGTVDFIEDVRLFLGQEVELRTDSLHYDLNTETGTTKDVVRFYTDEISGQAEGLHYNQNTRLLRFERNVDLAATPKKSSSAGKGQWEEFHAVSGRAVTHENLNRIELLDNARVESESFRLTGDAIEAVVDAETRKINSLIATGDAQYRSTVLGDTRNMIGDRMVFHINPESRNPEKILISGHAEMTLVSPSETRLLKGTEIDLYIDSEHNTPSRVDGRVGVRLEMDRGEEHTLVAGEDFSALFAPESGRLKHIGVRRRALISMTGAANTKDNEIRAEQIDMYFREGSEQSLLEKLRAENNAEWRFSTSGSGSKSGSVFSGRLTSGILEMRYSDVDGTLDTLDAFNKVVMAELPSGNGDDSPANTIAADRVRFRFYRGKNMPMDMEAEGNIQVVQEARAGNHSPDGPAAFRTWSDRMKAAFEPDTDTIVLESATQWGNFRYESESASATAGQCDYNAGEETVRLIKSPKISLDTGVTTGDTVDIEQGRGVVHVHGNVRTVLASGEASGPFGGGANNSGSVVLADTMEHFTESSKTQYETNVFLLSEDQQLRSDTLDIYDGGNRIESRGKVRHYLYRSRMPGSGTDSIDETSVSAPKDKGNSEDMPISIRSSRLVYSKAENSVTYSGGVSLRSTDLVLTSRSLEAILDDDGREIEQSVATGDVFVLRGKKECRGDVARYFSVPGKFVVTGAPAELYDPEGESLSGPRLTYIVDDDRILLEEN